MSDQFLPTRETLKFQLQHIRAVQSRWHAQATALGFDGVAHVLDASPPRQMTPANVLEKARELFGFTASFGGFEAAVNELTAYIISGAHNAEFDPYGLTKRELEVLRALAEGNGYKAAGQKLNRSRNTLSFHMTSVLSKMNCPSLERAILLAERAGLLKDI